MTLMSGGYPLTGHVPDPSAAPEAKVFWFFSSEKNTFPGSTY